MRILNQFIPEPKCIRIVCLYSNILVTFLMKKISLDRKKTKTLEDANSCISGYEVEKKDEMIIFKEADISNVSTHVLLEPA